MNQLRILVLEDDPFQRFTLVTVLRSLDIGDIHEAAEGGQALEEIAAIGGVDVVLCDLQMEGMDGVEFIRTVANRRLATGIILCSALEDELIAAVESLCILQGLHYLGRLNKPPRSSEVAKALADFKRNHPDLEAGAERSPLPTYPLKEIAAALDTHDFYPFYQPKIRVSDGAVAGAEALARWRHPTDGWVSPAAFIPAMEEAGLVGRLTDVLMQHALADLARWQEQGIMLNLAINVSPVMLQDTTMPSRLMRIALDHGISPRDLTVEVTETALASEFGGLLESITRLRMAGFGISIDDFGTGYSSLQQLNELPFTEIKIDRAFVHRASQSRKRDHILAAMLDLSRKLNLKSIAEGVETQEDWNKVVTLGCQFVQGFFIARPMPAGDFEEWLLRYTPRQQIQSA
ncbi:MAG: EAL domain-containing protein [Zoogloea sp.]|nr:EAL domain-containing protein [Zoogloea sp.]